MLYHNPPTAYNGITILKGCKLWKDILNQRLAAGVIYKVVVAVKVFGGAGRVWHTADFQYGVGIKLQSPLKSQKAIAFLEGIYIRLPI